MKENNSNMGENTEGKHQELSRSWRFMNLDRVIIPILVSTFLLVDQFIMSPVTRWMMVSLSYVMILVPMTCRWVASRRKLTLRRALDIMSACGLDAKIKGDAAIAMISVGALAFGYLIMNIFSTSSNLSGDVCSTLFGSTSILTLTQKEVWVCIVLSIAVVIIFVLFYNKIFAVTFDENFAKAVGTSADTYNLLIAIVIAVIIVLAMNLVGSLLISALVIFPALSAMRIFRSFKSVTIFSAILSVICAFCGMVISILAGTPVGSTIVAVDVAAFAICSLIGLVSGGR